jgi:hypothetical protein
MHRYRLSLEAAFTAVAVARKKVARPNASFCKQLIQFHGRLNAGQAAVQFALETFSMQALMSDRLMQSLSAYLWRELFDQSEDCKDKRRTDLLIKHLKQCRADGASGSTILCFLLMQCVYYESTAGSRIITDDETIMGNLLNVLNYDDNLLSPEAVAEFIERMALHEQLESMKTFICLQLHPPADAVSLDECLISTMAKRLAAQALLLCH